MPESVKQCAASEIKMVKDVINLIDVTNSVSIDSVDVVTSKSIYEALSKLRDDIKKIIDT